MVFAVEWARQEGILGKDQLRYRLKWDRGSVLERNTRRHLWDFQYQTVTVAQNRRPDLTIEYRDEKRIVLVDMVCLREESVEAKEQEKKMKYQQLCYDLRTQSPGW